jgi:hypothetical protein
MRTSDGIEITATEPRKMVRELRAASHLPGRSVAEFMQLAASRAALLSGKPVRSDSAENFVTDLIAAGLLIGETQPEEKHYDC